MISFLSRGQGAVPYLSDVKIGLEYSYNGSVLGSQLLPLKRDILLLLSTVLATNADFYPVLNAIIVTTQSLTMMIIK